MKKIIIGTFIFLLAAQGVYSQGTRFYGSSSGEMIFSFAVIDQDGEDQGSVMRWTPFFNVQGYANLDFANTFGLFTGLGIRNVGFIYDSTTSVRKKFRTYNLGIPVGIKIGKLDFMFLFAGYEIEFPFHYKEKRFENEIKEKFSVWFSERVEPIQHTLMAGIQFPYGTSVKFKYYLTNFHNQDYVETIDGEPIKPYYDLKTNVFYFSIAWNMFSNPKAYRKKGSEKATYR
jgi:hypothetical protein